MKSKRIVGILSLIVSSISSLWAQTINGSITGTVVDPQQSAILGAKVAAVNVGTNGSRRAVSTATGGYTISGLEPATYRVRVEADGFDAVVFENIIVGSTEAIKLDVQMKLGQINTVIQVTAEAPLIQKASSTVQYSLSEKELDEMPLQGQQILNALGVLPGIVGDAGSELSSVTLGNVVPGAGLAVAGSRNGMAQFKADGIDNTSIGAGRITTSFSSATVQEVSVQLNSFSAEFGRTGGGVIQVTTKSGTNQVHGLALTTLQNDKLNASPYIRLLSKGKQRLFRGSASVGGPVYIPKLYNGRDKTFFFASFEPQRQSTGFTTFARMPTELERQGDFSQSVYDSGPNNYPVTIYQQFVFDANGNPTSTRAAQKAGVPNQQWPENKIPSRYLSNTAQKLIAFMPMPNMPLDSAGNNFSYFRAVRNVDNRWLAKLDQAISNTNRMSFRIARVPTDGMRWALKDNPIDQMPVDTSRAINMVIADTHTFGGNKVNEFRAGYNRLFWNRWMGPAATSRNWFQELGIPSLLDAGFPKVTLGNSFYALGPNINGNTRQIENNYQINDTLSWFRGRHNIRAGFEAQKPQQNLTDFTSGIGSWGFGGNLTNIGSGVNTATVPGIGRANALTGFSLAQLLLGYPDSVSISGSIIPYQYRWSYYAGFLQDDVKVTRDLTLNLGVRYQVEVSRSEKNHNQGTYVNVPITTTDGKQTVGAIQMNGLGGYRDTMMPVRYNNLEPRIGLAYNVKRFRVPFVIRAAYGISHIPTTGMFMSPVPDLNPRTASLAGNGGQDGKNVNLDWNKAILPGALPAWPDNGLFTDLLKVNTPVMIGDKASIPYTQQWNFSLGFQLHRNWGLETSYVGSKGTQLFGPALRFNLPDLDLYKAAQIAGTDLNARVPNPLGFKDANGNIATLAAGDMLRPNPYLAGSVQVPITQGFNSNYNALQVSLRKSYSNGLQFTANYTFSKSIDDASCSGGNCGNALSNFGGGSPQFYNGSRKLERSVSTYDIPHVFNLTFIYDLPFGRGKHFVHGASRALDVFIGGWKASAIERLFAGQPYQIQQGSNAGYPSDAGVVRPNIVQGVSFYNPDWEKLRGSAINVPYLNSAAFAPVPRFELGTAPRTMPWLRYPKVQSFDFSLLKDVGIWERVKAQLRIDMFNALNHPTFTTSINDIRIYNTLDYTNYVVPPTNLINAAWSKTNPGATRVIQVGLRVQF